MFCLLSVINDIFSRKPSKDKEKVRKKIVTFIPLLTLPFSSTVLAEGQTEQVLTLDSMAVTAGVPKAQLAGIDIKSLPVASTVINQEEIKRLKFVDPDELLDRIPGETQVRNLRIPNGSKSYTLPLVDGVALGSPLSGSTQKFGEAVSSQDIERIEILKGPVSALYHNNTFGGVINVITQGATQLPEQNTRFWAEAGNYDRYRGGIRTQGNLKGVGYIVDYSSWNIGAYREIAKIDGIEKEVGEERQQASAKLIFHPDEVSSLTLHGSYLNKHETTPGDLEESDFTANDKGIGKDGFFSDKESFLASARYTRDFTDVDHLDANFVFRYEDVKGISRFGGNEEDIDIDINGKLTYKHDFNFLDSNIIIGTDIYQGTNDDFNPGDGSNEFASTGIYSGFAQIQFSPIENLQVTAGVRHESIDLKFTSNRIIPGSPARPGRPATPDRPVPGGNTSYSATLPKVGISYDFLDTHRVWFAYGEGFLVPTTSKLYTGRGNNPNLNPEEAEHFEVGLRGILPLFGNDLTYDTSYYYQDISQYVVTNDLFEKDTQVNAGKVNIQGVETVLEYQPSEYIRFGVTHTFASNIFKEFIDTNGDDLSGEELNRSPEHHINGRVAIMPIEGLAIEIEVDSSTSYSTVDNSSKDPQGRFSRDERINLRLTYDKGPYELWFHALNIGDVKEDRVGFSTRSNVRSIRTVDGIQIYGGIAYNF